MPVLVAGMPLQLCFQYRQAIPPICQAYLSGLKLIMTVVAVQPFCIEEILALNLKRVCYGTRHSAFHGTLWTEHVSDRRAGSGDWSLQPPRLHEGSGSLPMSLMPSSLTSVPTRPPGSQLPEA